MKRILMIEDDDAIRTELKTLLSANGYQPVEDGPCDLVLMDVNLPGESGYTLCRKLRETSNTPVIFLTARKFAPFRRMTGRGCGYRRWALFFSK